MRAQVAPALIYNRRMITPSSSLLPKLTYGTAKDLMGHFPPKKCILSGSQQHLLLSPWLPGLTTSYTPAIQTSPDSFPRRPTFVVSLFFSLAFPSGAPPGATSSERSLLRMPPLLSPTPHFLVSSATAWNSFFIIT